LEIAVAGSTLAVLALCSGSLALMAAPLFGAAVFVFASGPGPIWRFLVSRPVQHLGRVSYSLYMLHAVVFVRLSPLLRTGGRPATEILLPDQRLVVVSDPFVGECLLAAGLALVLVLSHLLYLWIEEPCRQFGRTLVARLRPAAVLPGVPA
jgi:peptidoglycan/LPS O-acetylase OafA/YrhL